MRLISNYFVIGKLTDLILQTIVFFIVIYFMTEKAWGLFAMFLMAGVQYISTIIWLIVSWRLPRSQNRKVIQRVFLWLGSWILIGSLAVDFRVVGILISGTIGSLVIIGPMLGLWYFITTAIEISFYNRVLQRKSFF